MPRKPKIEVMDKNVRKKVQETKGRPSHIGRPTRATGRRAERIAAKQKGTIQEMPRDVSHDNKKKLRSGTSKVRKAA